MPDAVLQMTGEQQQPIQSQAALSSETHQYEKHLLLMALASWWGHSGTGVINAL